MIEFRVTTRISGWKDLSIVLESATIELGPFDEEDSKQVARHLLSAAYFLGPAYETEAKAWLKQRLIESCLISDDDGKV